LSVLGLIPARGGSKRIPRKNIRLLGEHPLVLWTIYQAKESVMLDGLAVSTEDREIADLCCVHCDVIRRPPEMAHDTASSYPLMLHALDLCGGAYEYLCLLQPTSPFRDADDIDQCIAALKVSGAPAMASFTQGGKVPNGAIYAAHTSWLREGGNFDGPAVEPFWMPPERSLDIDTEDDWSEAETALMAMA